MIAIVSLCVICNNRFWCKRTLQLQVYLCRVVMFSVYTLGLFICWYTIKGHFNVFLWCVINVVSGVLDLILMDWGIFFSCQFFLRHQKNIFVSRRRFLSVCETFPHFTATLSRWREKEEKMISNSNCVLFLLMISTIMMMTMTLLEDKAMIMCLILQNNFGL